MTAQVSVPTCDNSEEAKSQFSQEISAVQRPSLPPAWLPIWQACAWGVPAAVLIGAVEHIGPMGPVGAAAWIGVNWWVR
eukprot:CAMPEP_0172642668 /NCGR_PEP_ID=MMETSP1068-20121228/233254_1 /TAXON_ID=35684 /ORGANISM="Pseudopedinella elastica, Strain CCMP716" /LENGTH=78 /DNA_ID=CAMNT_0013456539 /DNA_START=548 /DNA_END=784 /DNA_ORIENTATION=-